MINSRNIDDLRPLARVKCREFIAACERQGIRVLITSTYRDNESQAALYAQGRTKPGKIVTYAKAGDSYHNHRVAFDFVPLVGGQPAWNDRALFRRCGAIAKSCGLEWGGDWKKPDMPHCQFTGGQTLAQLKAGAGKPKKALPA